MSGSFLDTMASMGDLVTVSVEPGPASTQTSPFETRCLVQATTGFFEVSTPIYKGDTVALPDPRGGTERRYASQVKVNNSPALEGMSHIAAKWGDPPAPSSSGTSTVVHGPIINVTGSGATQIAWDNMRVEQHNTPTTVAPGFERLAETVANILENVEGLGVDAADQANIADEATDLLAEVSKSEPDVSRLGRGLMALKGAIAPIALQLQGGVGDGARDMARTWVEQLGSGLLPPM
ncbi:MULTISPECIES: hypothetical protein [Clavibacter]|uniref:Uncharacterized protein n=2 Tax=Clavibacter TaxID=1573 RepID=A0A399NY18_9MICO|nr:MULTISPECIES: hypothetical protein [Clavibacter]KDP89785.1 hypothetical protein W824_14930 [Clavibacter cf. michiganensis LMG 26808]RII99065.1 hypothetical protein DZF96_00015 [Clavibacter michiganensis]UKF26681.1 hypothetical protein KYT88_15810 [Clavibacter sp. A6099]